MKLPTDDKNSFHWLLELKFNNYKNLINQGLRLNNVMSAKQWLSYGKEHNILNFKYVTKTICFPYTCAYKQN